MKKISFVLFAVLAALQINVAHATGSATAQASDQVAHASQATRTTLPGLPSDNGRPQVMFDNWDFSSGHDAANGIVWRS